MATDDDSDIPETGAVFTYGKSKFADNAPNKFWIRNDKVLQVACGDEHTALVAESGRVFTFGANDWGQLGLGHTKPAFKPSCVKSLKGEKVRLVGCGRSTTYVATESGKLFSFGANGDSQLGTPEEKGPSLLKPVQISSLQVQQYTMLSGGADHAAALTAAGDVYVWGGGSEGQLGLGSVDEAPSPVRLPLEEPAVCVACGYYHTAIVTASGKLLTFGESEGGKLGLGETPSSNTTPQAVDIPAKVTWAACGGTHTVAVTESGSVYTFGEGSNGQLGHGTVQLNLAVPQEIALMKDTKLKYAACGENHTALISDKGQLYTFGDGRHGKLALGDENFANQFKPSTVMRFEKFAVEQVSCGGCHMLVIARPRVENGALESSEDESEEETIVPKPSAIDALRRSEDLELTGSFSARDRRREKQDPMGSIGSRTLPPLNGSTTPIIAARTLPSLHSAPPSENTSTSPGNPLNRSMLPPLKKEDASVVNSAPPHTNDRHSDGDGDSGQESDSSYKKVSKKSPVPVPKPRQVPPSPKLARKGEIPIHIHPPSDTEEAGGKDAPEAALAMPTPPPDKSPDEPDGEGEELTSAPPIVPAESALTESAPVKPSDEPESDAEELTPRPCIVPAAPCVTHSAPPKLSEHLSSDEEDLPPSPSPQIVPAQSCLTESSPMKSSKESESDREGPLAAQIVPAKPVPALRSMPKKPVTSDESDPGSDKQKTKVKKKGKKAKETHDESGEEQEKEKKKTNRENNGDAKMALKKSPLDRKLEEDSDSESEDNDEQKHFLPSSYEPISPLERKLHLLDSDSETETIRNVTKVNGKKSSLIGKKSPLDRKLDLEDSESDEETQDKKNKKIKKKAKKKVDSDVDSEEEPTKSLKSKKGSKSQKKRKSEDEESGEERELEEKTKSEDEDESEEEDKKKSKPEPKKKSSLCTIL